MKFLSARWKNILSTGNVWTEIQLDKNPTTLISGDNGAGKSTLLDVLCFVLFNKPFRKIKKEQLLNSINQRDGVGEVVFENYGKTYRIVRGIKPSIFEIYCDGILLNQPGASKDYQHTLENQLLRMDLRTFTQIVILGSSSFVPFMQLKSAVRREVIEDLLDIKVFSSMSSLLKDKMSSLREKDLLNNKDIQAARDLYALQLKNKEDFEQDNQEAIDRAYERIAKLEQLVEDLELEEEAINEQVAAHLESITHSEHTIKKLKESEDLSARLTTKKKALEKVISFYETSDTCPTCEQVIDETTKSTHCSNRTRIIEGELQPAIDQLAHNINHYRTMVEEIHKIQAEIARQQSRLSVDILPKKKVAEREIVVLTERIVEMKEPKTFQNTNIFDELEAKIKSYEAVTQEHSQLSELYSIASVVLRDTGIKSKIVKQYIPVINALVNKYLAAMDFFVKFELDEQFNETILSRHRDDFTYESFSEGEKQKIDLALMFTWRQIARMKNSVSTNLLIMDEVFDSSLDPAGVEFTMDVLNNLAGDSNTFIISHRGDVFQDKFKASIRFEKHGNFSRIAA